jgi:hypothetical protein
MEVFTTMSRFSVIAVVLVLVATHPRAVQSGLAEASVRPVRFENTEAAALTQHTGGAQILDSHALRIQLEETDLDVAVVPRSTLIERCGDGDGCRIDMFLFTSDIGIESELPARAGSGDLFLNVDGDYWRFFNVDGSVTSSFVGDNNFEAVLTLSATSSTVTGQLSCTFTEGILQTCQLQVSKTQLVDPDKPGCLLRIGD